MIDPSKPPPSLLPSQNQQIVASDSAIDKTQTKQSGSEDLSVSPWASMFPSGATKQEMQTFIHTFLNDLMREVKKSDQKHKENLRKQQEHANG